MKNFIVAKVNPGIWMLKKIGANRHGGVLSQKKLKIWVDFILVLLPWHIHENYQQVEG
jgi:hypothetical protein